MMKMPALLVHKAWRKQTDDNGSQVDVKNDKTVGLRGHVTHTSLSLIRRGFVPGFVNYKKGCTRLTAASDKVLKQPSSHLSYN
jgi:hypothetical protein